MMMFEKEMRRLHNKEMLERSEVRLGVLLPKMPLAAPSKSTAKVLDLYLGCTYYWKGVV
jgi:hypothetical protein